MNPEGYVSKGNYYYYAKDHLGNNRSVFGVQIYQPPNGPSVTVFGGPQQEISYYPFGMPHHAAYPPQDGIYPERQPYKFGSKEYDEMHGLNWFDFDARYYSGIIPAFTTPDPLAEKYYSISPYAYCANNPVRYIDPDGRDWYENTLTGAVYYNNHMGKNDAGKGAMKGEGWRHMGANGMFTQKDGSNNDQFLVAQNGKEGDISFSEDVVTGKVSFNMSMMLEGGGQAEDFMSGQGYSKNPLVADVQVTETTQLHPEPHGPISISNTSEFTKKTHSWTYAQKDAKGSHTVIQTLSKNRESSILTMSTTENRLERRQYNYNKSQGMDSSTKGSILKIIVDIIDIYLGNRKK